MKMISLSTLINVAFNAMLDYYAGKIKESQIKTLIEPAIMYQRMISKAQEIFEKRYCGR